MLTTETKLAAAIAKFLPLSCGLTYSNSRKWTS